MKPQANTPSRPVRPGFTLPRPQMAGYLAGAVSTAAIIGAPQAEAAVTAVTFGFGGQITRSTAIDNWSVGTYGTILAGSGAADLWILNAYQTQSLNSGQGRTRFFDAGTVIGSGGNGYLGQAFFYHGYVSQVDFTSNQLDMNIGFKTSTNNWGWANVSWTEATKTLAINSAFVESVANTAITIAAIPEPSRALLALAGLGSVALRRRRKQAA